VRRPIKIGLRSYRFSVAHRKEKIMEKVVAVIVSLGLSVAFAAPTMAAATKTPTTKAACVKAKMSWDDATKKCTKSNM
jgi:hypothetical protein